MQEDKSYDQMQQSQEQMQKAQQEMEQKEYVNLSSLKLLQTIEAAKEDDTVADPKQ